jgi:hypothetical protein
MISLSASDIDTLKMAAFVAAFFVNRQAALILIAFAVERFIFKSTDSGLFASIWQSIIYFLIATVNIKLLSEIRLAFLCLGCLYWLAAIDYYVFEYATYFYNLMPTLINLVDLYLLYLLIKKGRNIARNNDAAYCDLFSSVFRL